jgi:hypothetical protein
MITEINRNMKRRLFYLLVSLFLGLNSVVFCNSEGDRTDPVNDGPYIFTVRHKLQVMWVENSIFKEEFITPENFTGIKDKFNLLCNYQDLTVNYFKKDNYAQSYNMIDSIGVISDIHGEYNSYITLLKAMGIIDNNLNWKFGKGHLVVLGDIFDKGDMVTEVLWHLFALEKQAAEAGGMVHILLGNHEVMVLSKGLFYINEKYKKVEKISNIEYFNLYSGNSVLGNWLRSKPVVISINDILFVHGGISIDLVDRNLSVVKINQIFSDYIVGKVIAENSENEEPMFLVKDDGPVWYRGYFTDAGFNENRLDDILHFYNKKHIVVGHTTSQEINQRFNNKILGVDAGIGDHKSGEMLIYKNGSFYKGDTTGKRIKL